MKWVEMGYTYPNQRFEILSESLKDAGLENNFEFFQTIEDNFIDDLQNLQKTNSVIKVAPELGNYDLKDEYSYPSKLLSLRIQDTFLAYDGVWLPRSYDLEALRVIMTEIGERVDISGGVLIFGSGPKAIAAFGALNFLGFSRFTIVDSNSLDLEGTVKGLQKHNFGVDINSASSSMITQLPGIFSVVVNTMESNEESEIIEELSFFNFLSNNGIVIDFRTQQELRFVEEARNLGALIVSGYDIASRVDSMWVKDASGFEGLVSSELKKIYLEKA